MARSRKKPGGVDLDHAEVDAAPSSAADAGGTSTRTVGGSETAHEWRPSWETPMETGINGYRGSGG